MAKKPQNAFPELPKIPAIAGVVSPALPQA